MGDVKVCRICLVTDVRMYDLRGFPLETYFEPIVGINPLCLVELPSYACSECAVLIKKYYLFREKCLRGQAALYDILHADGEITATKVKLLDRKQLNLISNLVQVAVIQESSVNATLNNFIQELKIEDDVQIRENFEEQLNHDVIEANEIKREDDYTDVPSPRLASSDDDEPLSLHKIIKEKKGKRKKGGKKKKKGIEEVLNISEEKLAELVNPGDVAEPTEPKFGRSRPKVDVKSEPKPKLRRTANTGGVVADDADIEDYVTIIKLSVQEQKDEITARQKSSNYMNAPFQCSLCFKGFIDTKAWKHHVAKHSLSAGDVECPICKFRFKNKRCLQKHAANHEKKYACKSCSYVSKTTTQARQHQRWHTGVTYKCQYCDEVSTKWTSYLSHVRIKHPSEFICGVCGYSFVSKLGLTMHNTMMHKDQVEKQEAGSLSVAPGPYCETCDVQFVSLEAFKRHMVTSVKHAQNNDFNTGCRMCGETFKTSEELRVHHRKEHARKRPKNYGKKPSSITWPANCEHCSEEIPNAREYWTHFRRAHPDKKYPIQKSYICEICGKSFRGNAFLVYHKRTHFEERAYKCEQCPKAFFNRTNLQVHEKTHSEHRPYPCTVCFKAFKSKGALDRHFRSHTGVKPYECEFCGKAFGQSNSRKLHVKTVHLKQPAPYISRNRLERRRAQAKGPPPPPNTFIF